MKIKSFCLLLFVNLVRSETQFQIFVSNRVQCSGEICDGSSLDKPLNRFIDALKKIEKILEIDEKQENECFVSIFLDEGWPKIYTINDFELRNFERDHYLFNPKKSKTLFFSCLIFL